MRGRLLKRLRLAHRCLHDQIVETNGKLLQMLLSRLALVDLGQQDRELLG